MTSNNRLLPAGYEELEVFVDAWALPDTMTRFKKRVNTPMEDLQAFYGAVEPRAQEALKLLDGYPIGEINGPEASLMHLLLMLIDVSLAIEVYKAPALSLSPAADRYSVKMDDMYFD